MKTLTLQDETWKELNVMKYAMGVETLDDLITKLILNYKTQLEKEE